MGDRFYQAQLAITGSCPGRNPKRKGRKMAWSPEKIQEAIELYTSKDPTEDNTIEILNEVAEELEESPNGVRLHLSKAGVYIKKSPGKRSAATGDKDKAPRTSKEDLQNALAALIKEKTGEEADMDIVSKLTGKAAQYFTTVFA